MDDDKIWITFWIAVATIFVALIVSYNFGTTKSNFQICMEYEKNVEKCSKVLNKEDK